MKKLTLIKKKILSFRKQVYAVLVFMFLLTGCYDFDFVNQPLTGDPNSFFDVQISVTVYGECEYEQALFGVLMPVGWTVDDTLLYQNTTTGDTCSMVYSGDYVQSMNYVDPPPVGYFWWVGIGDEEEYLGNLNFYMELRIFTDSQTGSFLLDYMVGDKYVNGINYARSNNHVITIDAPESITVINTNDHGPGSFRDAIDNVDFYGSINFNIDPSDTLVLESELNIYKDLTITGPEVANLVISGNNMVRVLSIPERNISLSNLTIINGFASNGGGIYAPGASVELSKIVIKNNHAISSGGGISGGNITFDSLNKCSIYDNFAEVRNDLGISCPGKIFLDTFSVINPTSFHAYTGLTFDIEYGMHEQTYENLYVSPSGSNYNSGLSADDPLKTINVAFSISLASQQNKQIIFLDSGEYKFSNQGAYFPLRMPEYVSLTGVSCNEVILDAEDQVQVVRAISNSEAGLIELTITGGHGPGYGIDSYGGGIHCDQSYLTLQNVNIVSNHGACGGGIYIRRSHVYIEGVLIDNNNANHSSSGGGIYCSDTTVISIKDSQIINNQISSFSSGGGIFLYGCISAILENVFISGNSAFIGGGIYCAGFNPILKNVAIVSNIANNAGGGILFGNSSPSIINSTITNNFVQNNSGGGILCIEANPTIINTIVWDNSPTEIYCDYDVTPVASFLTISNSDIMGGEEGIITNGVGYVTWLEGNIDADPLFVGSGDFPYTLGNESPCVNSGTPDTTGLNLPEFDLAGNPRLYGGRIEMGAYENQEVAVISVGDFEISDNKTDLNISPNPVTENATIRFSSTSSGLFDIGIYNLSGICIKSWQFQNQMAGEKEFKLDLKVLQAGIYFCRVQLGNETVTQKLIKY